MSRRQRIVLYSCAGTLLVLAAAVLVLAYVMLRPERFTRTLRSAASNAGLELTLTAPAHPVLWPRPGVRLQGLQLFVQGQTYPLLVADSGRIVVPWRTLLGGPTAITTLELDAPRLDLEQLQLALSTLRGNGTSAPSLPRIGTGITIRNGSLVRKDSLLLQRIDLRTGALMPDHAFTLSAHARNQAGRPLKLALEFTPRKVEGGAIALTQMQIAIDAGKNTDLRLAGTMHWYGGSRARFALQGRIVLHGSKRYRVGIDSGAAPAPADPRHLHVQIQGPAGQANLHLSPPQLADWWQRIAGRQATGPLPPPPVDGSIDAKELDFGSIRIKGLKIRSGNAIPAKASSTAAPATRGTTK